MVRPRDLDPDTTIAAQVMPVQYVDMLLPFIEGELSERDTDYLSSRVPFYAKYFDDVLTQDYLFFIPFSEERRSDDSELLRLREMTEQYGFHPTSFFLYAYKEGAVVVPYKGYVDSHVIGCSACTEEYENIDLWPLSAEQKLADIHRMIRGEKEKNIDQMLRYLQEIDVEVFRKRE